jgi:hypothetical protein
MKQKLTLVFAMLVLVTGAFAQKNSDSPDKKPALFGVQLNALDFKTPGTIKDMNSPRNLAGLRDMDYGLSLSYWRGLTSKIDFAGKFNAMIHDYATDRTEATTKTEMGLELEPTLNIRPFTDKAMIAPFLTAGAGVGYYTGKFGAYVPAGVGIQMNFNSVTYLLLQAQYRFALTTDVLKDHLIYSVGFAHSFGPEKKKGNTSSTSTSGVGSR